MSSKTQRSWAPFALIAIAVALLVLLLKLILTIIWALLVVVLVVLGAAAVGMLVAARTQKR